MQEDTTTDPAPTLDLTCLPKIGVQKSRRGNRAVLNELF